MIELPVCRWRREPTAPGRHACVSPRLVVGGLGVRDEGCATCYCRDHEPPPRPAVVCRHLGRRIAVEVCRTCPNRPLGAVRVGVHHCHLHGSCTIELPMAGHKLCRECLDRDAGLDTSHVGDIRHLMYFVCPLGEMWRWNLQQLRRRIGLFNGRRLVFCVEGDGLAPLHHVQAELAGCGVEWMTAPNHPALKEYVGFPPLLRALQRHRGERDVTFYGHAKGVSSYRWGNGVQLWAESMYSALLDYWPAIQRELRTYMTVGVWRKHQGWYPISPSRWHYAGSFRWVRNRDLYSRRWDDYIVDWVCPEDHVARVFQLHESSCLYGDIGSAATQLYGLEAWPWAEEQRRLWEHEHMSDLRNPPLLLTVILTSHRKPQYVHDAIRSVLAQTSPDWRLVVVDSGDLRRAGEFAPYSGDARINVMDGPQEESVACGRNPQAAKINYALEAGFAWGDLVMCLSDDDVLSPGAVEQWLAAAREHPDQSAWYAPADVHDVYVGGRVGLAGRLETRGVLDASNPGRGHVDGMQVCCRLASCPPWPEGLDLAPEADGYWIDALAAIVAIHPLPQTCGIHRHTPLSTFTRSAE